jgi:hypothetical protein
MAIWNKKKKAAQPSPVAGWIKGKVTQLKERWASVMATLAGRLSLQQQKVTTILFCLVASAYCVFLIVQGLTESNKKTLAPVWAISKPVAPKEDSYTEDSFKSNQEYVMQLSTMMDSLQRDPYGRYKYDSIRRFRPGLLDALKILELYYQNE